MFYSVIQRDAETLHSLFYTLLFFLPIFLTDWEVNAKWRPVLFLASRRMKYVAGTKKVCHALCDWYLLTVQAIRWAKLRTFNMRDRGLGLIFCSKPAETSETLLPKGSGSKAGYVPGMSMLCLCLLWIWASISLVWKFSMFHPLNPHLRSILMIWLIFKMTSKIW